MIKLKLVRRENSVIWARKDLRKYEFYAIELGRLSPFPALALAHELGHAWLPSCHRVNLADKIHNTEKNVQEEYLAWYVALKWYGPLTSEERNYVFEAFTSYTYDNGSQNCRFWHTQIVNLLNCYTRG